MGSTSSVFVAPGGHIWVAERCGANTCADSSVPPILEFDESGKLLQDLRREPVRLPAQHPDGQRGQPVAHRRPGEGRQRPPGFQIEPGWQDPDDPRQGGRRGRRPGHVQSAELPSRLRATAPSLFPTVTTPGAEMRASSSSPRMESSSSSGEGTGRRRDSSKFRTRWPSTRRGACLSGTAPTTGFRSSTRTANSSKSGSSSAGPAESSSTKTTSFM